MIALVSPKSSEVATWEVLGEVSHFNDLANISDWSRIDVVVYDLYRYRIGTSSADLDAALITDTVAAAARANPDALWVLVSGPAMGNELAAAVIAARRHLLGGETAVVIVKEPDVISAAAGPVAAWLEAIAALDALDVTVDAPRDITRSENRCLRRLMGAVDRARLRAFGSGQGDTLTLEVRRDHLGAALPRQVMKLGGRPDIDREIDRYRTYVQDKLGEFRYPQQTERHRWFAADAGGLLYSYVGGPDPTTLAHEIREAAPGATAIVDELFNSVLNTWLNMRIKPVSSVRSVVDAHMRNYSLQEAGEKWSDSADPDGIVNPVPWLRDIRDRHIELPIATTIAHGDLHGYNVLIDPDRHPWLIDFYWTGEYWGLFDYAYADCFLLLHHAPDEPPIVDCTADQLLEAETRYYGGGNGIRPEIDRIRELGLTRWGAAAAGGLHLGRVCTALRSLRYPATDVAKAKVLAGLAAAEAQRLHPEWEQAEQIEEIAF